MMGEAIQMQSKEGIKLGYYRHYKGNIYIVKDVAEHTETEEELVIYGCLKEPDKLWARPVSMWNDVIDGKPRFEYLGKELKEATE